MIQRRFGFGVQPVAAVSMIASGPGVVSWPFLASAFLAIATSRMLYVMSLRARAARKKRTARRDIQPVSSCERRVRRRAAGAWRLIARFQIDAGDVDGRARLRYDVDGLGVVPVLAREGVPRVIGEGARAPRGGRREQHLRVFLVLYAIADGGVGIRRTVLPALDSHRNLVAADEYGLGRLGGRGGGSGFRHSGADKDRW